ncbi:LacI family DNA-binding transcriptional regulator [Arthrobacter sp. S39]|uniref:LacI family DNA-binding transcriptional regulator n=1 Tax=Arthrobacter sp. S39 TaxID=2509720 RepID=UPI001F5F9CC0|nr:LacI family DNA-binding transcriptional regulator [Arthrobacter sp. S39]
MSDVAFAAGVATATVSNVLNHPHKVAPSTRERVEQAIADLDFQRSEEAVKLRRGKRAKPSRSSAGGVTPATDSGTTATRVEAPKAEVVAAPYPPGCLSPGTRAEIVAEGLVVGSGIVDASMTDGSAVWLWMDCGGGRRLIHSHDGLELRASQTHGKGVPELPR